MQKYDEIEQLSLFGPDSWSGKTCPEHSAAGRRKEKTSGSSSKRLRVSREIPYLSLDLTPGRGNLLGEPYWELISPWLGESSMLNTGVSPKEEKESSLSQILQDEPPRGYYLSKKACRGILRRAFERGKELPEKLNRALEIQSGIIQPDGKVTELEAYHINQRNEGIDLHGVSGALMATTNMQMQTFVTQPDHKERNSGQQHPIAFAANQRDEVRELHDVAGALGAQPGMKQQTFIAVAFSAGAGKSAGGVGYQEEIAPTLKGTASGNMAPSVLCLNDQGGNRMVHSENVAGTLRAQEHGHQPLVFENHGIDARYTGPHSVAPTMSARYGTGGNNVPLVAQEESNARTFYGRQRVDKFEECQMAGTLSRRQYKDATDLVCNADAPIGETPLLIRRLTPLECERLQGFPDGWTDLPKASDSSRYKALGNSVAIPCVEYVLRGIRLAYPC